jgi:hypothetical protein
MSPIKSMLSNVVWQETGLQPNGDLPYATHAGELDIAGTKLRCYRLNTGESVFDADDFSAFLTSLAGS